MAAERMMLVSVPASPAAVTMVEHLAKAIAAWETRRKPRGPGQRAALAEAVGAIAGDVLTAGLRRGAMVYRSRSEGTYSGHVGYTAAMAALNGMTALGFLCHHSGIRFSNETFEHKAAWAGLTSRYEASGALLALAAFHGITSHTVKQAFGTRFPIKAEAIKSPIVLKRFREEGGQPLRIPRGDLNHKAMAVDVRHANRLLAACTWAGCQPPALRRTFRGTWRYGGRWTVAGDAPIQGMPPEDRLCILLNGRPVCEVDARGSQLSIVAALAGVADLQGDPYQLGGLARYDRATVKAAATVTLGTGSLRKRWPNGGDYDVSMVEITAALVSAHPYITDLSGLLDVPSGHVSVRLQNIESLCLTDAMRTLWAADIPCVPIHDSLLTAAGAADSADAALRAGYLSAAGAIIQTKQSTGRV